jgi:hypothetical protein
MDWDEELAFSEGGQRTESPLLMLEGEGTFFHGTNRGPFQPWQAYLHTKIL